MIVRDMWLTGFDAPGCHTMYIDKPMKGHSLMQAIAWVNRVFKDKPGGLVVNYIGIANELKLASETCTGSGGKGKPIRNTSEYFTLLFENIDKLHDLMHGCDCQNFEADALILLPKAINHIMSLAGNNDEPDGKKRFLDVMAKIRVAHTFNWSVT